MRDRKQSEQRLIRALGDIVAKQGFKGLGVDAVARTAGVDKVLIYSYFDGLPNLLKAYGESGDFWPVITEVLDGDSVGISTLPIQERLERVILGLLNNCGYSVPDDPYPLRRRLWRAAARYGRGPFENSAWYIPGLPN
ncbi:TetR/AcrR family transcriptional regulator [Vreelandella nigrificans]|uniref:HTH tetR-type domain-containing protein n=1 Tax=Vreelandella nigrificans TaxID=2042704 RepID=A0A2A4HIK2_9GAMM|nr:TetR/AcrR family transcriptional regulator [Halomonas nigrificans]PCF93913.1 hypothetical protein CPA45_20075 [Halomonas nigrificans]